MDEPSPPENQPEPVGVDAFAASELRTKPPFAFFAQVAARHTRPEPLPAIICVSHLVESSVFYLPALASLGEIVTVLSKPRSAISEISDSLQTQFPTKVADRREIADPDLALALVEEVAADRDLTLMDIGGYFAPALPRLSRDFSGRIVGVVEDTENGLQAYEGLASLPCPLLSVARSPLKNAEDHLVGAAVVYSVETLLRSVGQILQGRTACVIGYGKVGRGTAQELRARGANVLVAEIDPIRRAEAMSHGFYAPSRLDEALRSAGIVVSATGRQALGGRQFRVLRQGAFVAAVTSADDELVLDELTALYESRPYAPDIEEHTLRQGGHSFYLLNKGNSVNFLHGGVLGPAIYLVQAELLECLARLFDGPLANEFHEIEIDQRRELADIWLAHFQDE